MADGPHGPLKRNASESDISSSDNESDFSADDSIADRDYRPTVSGSESPFESEQSISGEESSDENFEEPVQNVTQQAGTSRGVLVTPDKSNPSRWRKTNIERREKKKRQIKRNLGCKYESSRGKTVLDRKIGPSCNCKKKCRERLLGKETDIFNSFWNLGNYKAQNTYLFGSIKAVPKKRSYKKKIKRRESSRKVTYQYFVKVNGIDIQLCKQEFLASHGLQKSSKRVRLICNQISDGRSVPQDDKRGKHSNRPNRTPLEQVQSVHDHIRAFPKYVSHYSRKKNPSRVYLDHDISISGLYKDFYIDWCREKNITPVKEDKYRRIFCNEYNIGFKLPKSDTCLTCDSMKIAIQTATANKNEEDLNRLKLELELHHRRAEAMSNNMKEEVKSVKQTNRKVLVIAFDLQQTLPTPSLTVGPAFYLRKAWTYNLGIHDCISGQASMFMWTEATAKRGSEEIASILLKYLSSRETNEQWELVVFTDNCGGQNKNWLIMALWLQLVREKKFKSIEHRFLVSGHTYLPCDRDFAQIEKHKRYLRQIYCPEDWYEAVRKSKRANPFEVIVMEQKDFLSFQKVPMVKKNITEDKEPVNFTKARCFRFESGEPNTMFIKHELNGNLKKVNVGKRGNSKKVEDLKKLLRYIPPINQNFYVTIFEQCAGEHIDETEDQNIAEDVDGED
ncbi:unnamed protein product [Ceutorhynchus assimilis]|uniref:DUF7869 domain-containing protein n=1 Tax=Ceutorhynchus assimilis TaxID=467358 RepID=A0A9N9MF10_9CUCU|nr:unnamed protein product [Ceutorhynchus assimilis]